MATILLLRNTDDGQLKLATLSAVAFAHKLSRKRAARSTSSSSAKYWRGRRNNSAIMAGQQCLVADQAKLKHPVADKSARSLRHRQAARLDDVVAQPRLFPRTSCRALAALLDAGMLTTWSMCAGDATISVFKRHDVCRQRPSPL